MLEMFHCLLSFALISSTLAANQVVLTCGTGNDEQGPGLPGPPGKAGPRGETGLPGPPGPKGEPCDRNVCTSSLEELQRRIIAFENQTAHLSRAVQEIEGRLISQVNSTTGNSTSKWLFPGNSYKYHIRLKKMTYYESESYCQTLGGHPAGRRLINTDLLRFLRAAMNSKSIERIYVGLKLRGKRWRWIDRSSANGVPWYPGQPSGGENCAELLELRGSFGINDIGCSGVSTQGALCEVQV